MGFMPGGPEKVAVSLVGEEITDVTYGVPEIFLYPCRGPHRKTFRSFRQSCRACNSSPGHLHTGCDVITAYSHVLQAHAEGRLAIRRFRPRVANNVSILTPGYATHSMVSRVFIAELNAALARIQTTIGRVFEAP